MSEDTRRSGSNVGYATEVQRAVRVEYRSIPTSDSNAVNGIEYVPDEGWFVDEVLPAFASNGAGVVFVLRRML